MSERTSTIRAREIGAQLRRYRERAGLSQTRAGQKIALSTASMCRIEDGTKTSTPEEVSALLAIYGITGPPRDRLILLAKEAHERGWWRRHDTDFRTQFGPFAEMEARACSITTFELSVMPGLLQAPDYIEALMRGSHVVPEAEAAQRVEARLGRHRILFRDDPVHLSAFLDESILYRMVGSAAVMHRQFDYLRRLAQKPNVSIRILPLASGIQASAVGSFHLLRFRSAPTVVHVANWVSDLYIEEAADIEAHERAANDLAREAVNAEESCELITRRMRELERDSDVLRQIGWSALAKK